MSNKLFETITWTEKYRPTELKSIYSHEFIIKALTKCIKKKNLPHLLFYGPPGCGKTSTIFALTKQLFPQDIWQDRILELNASDERGINAVRHKIKNFAKNSVNNSNTNIPPWKIIILDEADTMTNDSQFALRRIIEKYSKITRFCIICNYKNKIIEPIKSRCACFYFKSLSNIHIMKRLKYICKNENVKYNNEILENIIKISRGDLRKTINYVQMCYNTFGNEMSLATFNKIAGILPQEELNNLFCFTKIDNIQDLIDKIDYYESNGYSLVNQIKNIYDYVIKLDIDVKKKGEICKKIVDIDYNLSKGCDETIQFLRLFIFIKNKLILP